MKCQDLHCSRTPPEGALFVSRQLTRAHLYKLQKCVPPRQASCWTVTSLGQFQFNSISIPVQFYYSFMPYRSSTVYSTFVRHQEFRPYRYTFDFCNYQHNLARNVSAWTSGARLTSVRQAVIAVYYCWKSGVTETAQLKAQAGQRINYSRYTAGCFMWSALLGVR